MLTVRVAQLIFLAEGATLLYFIFSLFGFSLLVLIGVIGIVGFGIFTVEKLI